MHVLDFSCYSSSWLIVLRFLLPLICVTVQDSLTSDTALREGFACTWHHGITRTWMTQSELETVITSVREWSKTSACILISYDRVEILKIIYFQERGVDSELSGWLL
jgi:hypothetical protein